MFYSNPALTWTQGGKNLRWFAECVGRDQVQLSCWDFIPRLLVEI